MSVRKILRHLQIFYLKQFRKKYNRPVNDISSALIKKMQQYNWPGNIRELQHAIERAVILSQEKTLQPDDLFLKRSGGKPTTATGFDLEDMEKTMIVKAMKRFNGNITDAAQGTGIEPGGFVPENGKVWTLI